MLPPRFGPPAFYDQRRTKEFHTYYEPFRTITHQEPAYTNLHDDAAVAKHTPVSSPDKALTAFCQLAAMKLNVDRAMIFLFDADFGYILAEATRSMTLRSEAQHAAGDGLWLGHTRIPRGFSVCEHTVNLPQNTGTNADDPATMGMAHIINNLESDMRFCNRPYVTDGPRLRYYAGVPIISPRGINVGALCALDDEPRDTTSVEEVELLVDLAASIMSHLEAVRAKAEFQRGSVMLGSLTAFVDDAMAMRDGMRNVPDHRQQKPSTPAPSSIPGSPQNLRRSDSMIDKTAPLPVAVQAPPVTSEDLPTGLLSTMEQLSVASSFTHPTPARAGDATEENKDRRPSDALAFVTDTSALTSESQMKMRVQKIYQLAAETLQRAMRLDGVIVLDAAGSSFDGDNDIDASQREIYPSSSGTATATESHTPRRAEYVQNLQPSDDVMTPFYATAWSSASNRPTASHISRQQIKSLTKKFQRGKIWHASADEESDAPSSSSLSSEPTNSPAEPRIRGSAQHIAALRQLLPDARSIMFFPIWNHSTGRWASSLILYDCSPLRTFSSEGELQFTRAFADVIMAELGRLDAQNLLQSKSTFISSISHELRTPLHGILGTVEHLKQQDLDTMTNQMVALVEQCGMTMLDTINHVLDYSQVDHIVRQHSSSEEDNAGPSLQRKGTLTTVNKHHLSSASISRRGATVNRMTETTIDSVVYSYYCNASAPINPKISIILDVDPNPSIDWTCRLNPGAWNRVCTNLIVNALKFTPEGYIHISLKHQPPPLNDAKGVATVNLVVTDTGRGMSRQFMQNSLFQPFEQENGIADGTGLGMSLVAKILKAIGGQISVRSVQGKGTTISVTVPMTRSRRHRARVRKEGIEGRESSPEAHDGQKTTIVANFIGDSWDAGDTASAQGRRLLRESIDQSLRSIRNLPHVRTTNDSYQSSEQHFDVIAERDLSTVYDTAPVTGSDVNNNILQPTDRGDTTPRPLLVICGTFQSMRRCITSVGKLPKLANTHVEYVIEPCGPVQLGKALFRCITSSVAAATTAERDSSGSLSSRSRYPASPRPELRRRSHSLFVEDQLVVEERPRLPRRQTNESSKFLSASTNAASQQRQRPPRDQSGNTSDYFSRTSRVAGAGTGKWTSLPLRGNFTSPASGPGIERSIHIVNAEPETILQPEQGAPQNAPTTLNPVALQTIVDAALPPASPEIATTASLTDQVVMLLVDDNAINMRLLKMHADKQKYRNFTAQNGLEAVEFYKAALSEYVQASQIDRLVEGKLSGNTTSDHEDSSANLSAPPNTDSTSSSTDRPSLSIPSSHPTSDSPSYPPKPPCLPRVILMDISMPVMDGFEATRQIRALEASLAAATKKSRQASCSSNPSPSNSSPDSSDPPSPSAPRAFIIAMTGLGSEAAQAEARASGMDLFLTKPVRFKELSRILTEHGFGATNSADQTPATRSPMVSP